MDTHPDVFVPAHEKEPKYFVEERGWPLGRAWYEGLFAEAGDAKARGEFSTDYTVFPLYDGVPERMAALLPDVRLIYVMRNPIDHMRSAYSYSLTIGTEARPMREALLTDARYMYECEYALQIQQYLEHFALDQLLLLTAEELRFKRHETMSKIFSFIGVDAEWIPPNLDEEFNRSQLTAPRPWARRAGGFLISTGLGERVPARFQRIGTSRFGLREVQPEELHIDDDLKGRLVGYLQRDLECLRQWMGPSFDAWGLLDG
jgi:Sulfotransferase domain